MTDNIREAARYRADAEQPGTAIAVATTSTSVVARNGDRFEIHVTNDSDTTIYLRLAATGAAVGSGIRLNASGGSFSSTFYNGPICAIHGGTGTKTLCVVEV